MLYFLIYRYYSLTQGHWHCAIRWDPAWFSISLSL